MRKFRVFLFGCLVMALALLCGCGEKVKVDKETAQKAIVETALAYYYKNPYCQYEFRSLTIESRFSGPMVNTHYAAPEYASADHLHYSQCTDFVCDVIYQALGYQICGGIKAPGSVSPSGVEGGAFIFLTGPENVYQKIGMTESEIKTEVDKMKALLEPGDIIACNHGDDGHAMMFLGDCFGDGVDYAIHCWGAGFVTETGEDKFESKGSIKLQKADDLLFSSTGSPNYSLYDMGHVCKLLGVYRFTEASDYDGTITKSAASRLKYQGLSITRTTSISQYNSLPVGDELTVNLTLKNNGTAPITGLKVEDTLPKQAKLVSGELKQTVDLASGEEKTLSYVITLSGEMGEVVTLPAGKVADIPTREIEVQLSGKHLTDAQVRALQTLCITVPKDLQGQDLDTMNSIYKAVLDIDLGLPTCEELVNAFFEKKMNILVSEKMLYVKSDIDAAYTKFRKMVIDEHIGGRYVVAGETVEDQNMDNLECYYEPGDIIVLVKNPSKAGIAVTSDIYTHLYLGNGYVLVKQGAKKCYIDTFEATVAKARASSIYFALRPSLVMDDLQNYKIPEREIENTATNTEEFMILIDCPEILVAGEVTLEEEVDLSKTSLILSEGAKLNLGSFSTKVRFFQMAEDATITGDEGRLEVSTNSRANTEKALAQYAGLPIRIRSNYGDSKNLYDCKSQLAVFSNDLSTGESPLLEMFALIPAGWTMRMDSWYATPAYLGFANEGCTLDLNGQWIATEKYTGKAMTVIDSSNGEGVLYLRGKEAGGEVTQDIDIIAPGVRVCIGYTAKSTGKKTKGDYIVTGKLVYGTLEFMHDSTIKAGDGGELTQVAPTSD